MERKFGHCAVNWTIRNSFILPMKKVWQVHSPVFEVAAFKATRWQMVLMNKRRDDEFHLYFQLKEIILGEETVPFIGKCNLRISAEFENCVAYRDEFNFNEVCSEERMILINYKNEKDFMLSCNMCITCKLFITFCGVEEEIDTCFDIGIRELSQDLLILFENRLETDVTLEIRDTNKVFKIYAHKPILRSRNEKLKQLFDSKPDSTKFVVEFFGHYEEWVNIIRFLYTARMKYVLHPPSENYYAISATYDIEPITSFYQPDKLNLISTIPMEKFEITGTIPNFLTCEDTCLQSSQVQNDTLDTYCKIHLYPRSFQNEDHTCVCVEVGGKGHKFVFLEMFALDAYTSKPLKLIHGEKEDSKVFKAYIFEKRDILKQHLQDGNLKLDFNIQIINLNLLSDCKQYSSTNIVKYKPYFDTKNYSIYSSDMSRLYFDKHIDDKVIFKMAEGVFSIHKCILSARAPLLYEKILQSINVGFHNVRQCVFYDLVYFLYSGKCNSVFNLDGTLDLYDIAVEFKLNSLKMVLQHKLELKMKLFRRDQLLKVLQFSISRKLPRLQICAQKNLIY